MTFLHQLNDPQKDAVQTIEGPLLVLAGAGSGKTRVVTYRIAHLLEMGVPPDKILAVTFTNKAAGEMKERVRSLTNSDVLVCTFHSLGVRILRESIHYLGFKNSFTIYDEEDAKKLLKVCMEELEIKDKKIDPKAFKGMISSAKNGLQSPDSYTLEGGERELQRLFPQVYARYQERLLEYNALDFDDLLYLTVRLFREHPDVLDRYQDRWSFFLIDEYQDTNQAQYEIVHRLSRRNQNVCAVGDPDQSIYSWRGANIQNILNFEEDFPGARVVRLEQNYRSRSNILDAANEVIAKNTGRYDKHLWSDLGPGEKIKLYTADSEKDESRYVAEKIRYYHEEKGIALKDMAIFYRTNFQSRAIEDRLLFGHVPYVIVGGISFYQRREIKDILAFLRMVHSGADFISFSRTVNLPKRGIGGTTIEKIRVGARQEQLPIIEYLEALMRGDDLHFSIRLTAKQKQGLENYLQMIHELRRVRDECSLKELVSIAIDESGYLSYLTEDKETYDDRKGNLDELIAKASEWELMTEAPTLGEFLEELSLKSNLDEADTAEDRVNLMTIHNGKGLEYPVVFLVGLEEELFPHANSRDDDNALEEERRLCYVGMTRAKEYLYISHARVRFLWGNERAQRPSRFLKEIPTKFIEKEGGRATRYSFRSSRSRNNDSNDGFIENIDQTGDCAFVPGDAVFHREFGVGVIQKAFDGSVGLTYKVMFSKDHSVRNIVAKYAHLKKL